MKIFLPNSFKQEREYITQILFSEFLGLQYELAYHEKDTYDICLKNENKVIINDGFWCNIKENKGYLNIKNLPVEIKWAKNNFIPENNLPVIFGTDKFVKNEKMITTGIDIFASSFLMLTRWEEIVIKSKDKFGRFPCNESIAQKNNFHYRPIINEYVEFLWNVLNELGCKQKRKVRKFEIIPTHDIDNLFKYNNIKDLIRTVSGDIINRKSFKLVPKTINSYFKVKLGKIKDPYDTFDYFMDISEKNNLKSHFYFVAGSKDEADVRYNFLKKETKKCIENILQRGHKIGIHGGYSSFNNENQFNKEISRFKIFKVNVDQGRQHYLRFENPKTWQIWNNAGMKYDSSIGYTNDSGFKAGTCYEYPVFDVINRKTLSLIERPLIFMETVSREKHPDKEAFFNHCKALKNRVKKYSGQFVILWHNNNLNTYHWQDYKNLYLEIFE